MDDAGQSKDPENFQETKDSQSRINFWDEGSSKLTKKVDQKSLGEYVMWSYVAHVEHLLPIFASVWGKKHKDKIYKKTDID